MNAEPTIAIVVHVSMQPAMLETDRSSFEVTLQRGATVRDALLAVADVAPGFRRSMGAELYKERPHLPLIVSIAKTRPGYQDTLLNDGDELYLIPAAFGG